MEKRGDRLCDGGPRFRMAGHLYGGLGYSAANQRPSAAIDSSPDLIGVNRFAVRWGVRVFNLLCFDPRTKIESACRFGCDYLSLFWRAVVWWLWR